MGPKPQFKTDIPFSETKWPDIPAPTQTVILDLVCNLLEPLGHHRQTHVQPSKGKSRSRKRRRTASETADPEPARPPAPEISNHILIGLNSVTRHLSSLAARTAPPGLPASTKGARANDEGTESQSTPTDPSRTTKLPKESLLRPLTLVILPHPKPSSSLPHAHLPTLVYLSTAQKQPPTRLVALSTSAETRLASALHLPRVGAIGILEGAPGAAALVEYVREHVGPVECRWIEEGLKAQWKGVKTLQT